MVLVIGRKILGVRDFDTCSSLPGIDLGTSKSRYECYISGSLFQYGFYSHMFPLQQIQKNLRQFACTLRDLGIGNEEIQIFATNFTLFFYQLIVLFTLLILMFSLLQLSFVFFIFSLKGLQSSQLSWQSMWLLTMCFWFRFLQTMHNLNLINL